MNRKVLAKAIASAVAAVLVLLVLSIPIGSLPPVGGLTNPGGGIWDVADQAVHPKRMELTFLELDGTVTVYRDRFGIPHIFAATEHDLFFAQGFVHAEDRLWQMDAFRRVGNGELAEAFGAQIGSTDFVELDSFIRTIGLPHLARQFVAQADPAEPSNRAVTAYTEGVNAFLRHAGTAGLPLEFKLLDYTPRAWTNADSTAIGMFMAWTLSGTFEDLEFALLVDGLGLPAVEELFPVLGPFQIPVNPRTRGDAGVSFGPRFQEAARDLLARSRAFSAFVGAGPHVGSNNWAVAGSRTDTGLPRLANDPHLAFSIPAIWYENHLVGAGFDVYGVTFPGTPTVVLGQNRYVAWGATNVGADVIDLYRETIDGDRYLFQGQWRDLDVRTETIRVKGASPVSLTVRSTVHGPLVTERGETLAMRWTAQESQTLLRAFYEIDRARNWDEFKAALAYFPVPAQNFVYADVDGHIGMRSNGLYPIRSFDARFPADGASGDFEWQGFVPFDEYPETFDPPEGYVLSANQQPQADDYPYYMGWSWAPGYRARRIAEMLAADSQVTGEEIRRMQLDTLDVLARELMKYVESAVIQTGGCRGEAALCPLALVVIRDWDYRMDADKAAPAIWWRFVNHFREEMFGDEWAAAGVSDLRLPMPNVLEWQMVVDWGQPWVDDVRTPGVEEIWTDIVRRAFLMAVEDLTDELGPSINAWRWGDVHTREFPHFTELPVLGRGPYRSPGDSLTVNVAGGDTARGGPSWRLLADLSDLTKSVGVYPGGQSGNPLSPHYDDMLVLWLDGEYHDFVLPASASAMPAASVESALILRRG